MHSRASSVARPISAGVMPISIISRNDLTNSTPFALAMLDHMCAITKSCGTPSPRKYIIARLVCAMASPCSAAKRKKTPRSAKGSE